MPRNLRCILLCEDLQQERLFRPILERSFRRVRVEPRKPHGGASFVLQQMASLSEWVRRHAQESIALLIVIDGDEAGLNGRIAALRAAAGMTGAAWERRVAVCVPCRNVETWILWLLGEDDLDEDHDFKLLFRRRYDGDPRVAVEAAKSWFTLDTERRKSEEIRLPALAHGRREIDRLRQLAAP